jgi:o-succinylbenzoate synthase
MLNEILATLQVLSLPTRTNFRSVTKREVALFKGPNGWGEFSPFLEYEKEEASYWLGAGIEAAFEIDVERILNWYPGAKVVKIKVGDNLEADINRIQNAINFYEDFKIRLDVNGGWSVKQAEDSIARIIERFGIERFEYIEQPVATLEELRELKLPIPVAGDEVIRKAKDPFSVDLQGAVDILMLKVSPLGGIARSLEIAKHHNLPTVVSSALESAVGISQGIRLAASLPQLNYACGLATGKLLSNDVAELPIIAGRMRVSEVHPTGMLNFQAAPERITWWKNRIRDSFEVWQARN